jgi:hypothetical protein
MIIVVDHYSRCPCPLCGKHDWVTLRVLRPSYHPSQDPCEGKMLLWPNASIPALSHPALPVL